MKDEAVLPHIWKSSLPKRRGQWACASKWRARYTDQWVYYPTGEVYYGRTPLEAYLNWSKNK